MSDRFIYSCQACTNAVVGGHSPPNRACPACHATREELGAPLWSREGQIR